MLDHLDLLCLLQSVSACNHCIAKPVVARSKLNMLQEFGTGIAMQNAPLEPEAQNVGFSTVIHLCSSNWTLGRAQQ